jgi:hypothetical protein
MQIVSGYPGRTGPKTKNGVGSGRIHSFCPFQERRIVDEASPLYGVIIMD